MKPLECCKKCNNFKNGQFRNGFKCVFCEEYGKELSLQLYNEQKVNKDCATCKNCKHVKDYPAYVTGEECECTAGLECDTVLFSVKNCPKWIGKYESEEKKIMMDKDNIIKSLEKLGYKYSIKYYDDGTPMTYTFTQQDKMDPEASWVVSIENHHGDLDVDDWVIYCRYNDPEQKDWDGNQIDIQGAVEYEAMRLIMAFIENNISKEE